MEMGKGFAFVERQKHIHTEKNDYYIDLVFYNYLLKCFVLIDLKTEKVDYYLTYMPTKEELRREIEQQR